MVIAIPKGRVLAQAIDLLRRAGYAVGDGIRTSRRLVHDAGPLRLLVLRGQDVPTYVDYGAADVGIAGSDVLDEQGRDLYEPLDLGIGRCRMVVAEAVDAPVVDAAPIHMRVATKYPNLTRRHLQARGITAEIIKLSGSIELAPLLGLAHRIVDLVETGETLRQNGLREVETIADVSARLVVNPARLKLRTDQISELIDRLESTAGVP
ncbi:MAG: ATP phosphoribosyltransferase [Deltaproteobacteria bacterium]|nr:MAG: ATP phosphoribosyltransferase [Deltaproteobacteria bacterium]